MLKEKIVKIFLLILMLVSCLSFSGLTYAGDCANNSFGQGTPSITSNYKNKPGWFSKEEQLTLPSTGQVVNTQLIPSGANVNVHISGIIGFWHQISYGADAAYLYDVPPHNIHYPLTTPVRSLNTHTSNGKFDPQPPEYMPNHEYDWQTEGKGQSMSLWIQDTYYDDNTGSFAVTVSW